MRTTEAATLHVLSEIVMAVVRGDFAVLILIDLSAAFNTVDHEILLQRLQRQALLSNGSALHWFRSPPNPVAYVRRVATSSTVIKLVCGIQQGSVLCPILLPY